MKRGIIFLIGLLTFVSCDKGENWWGKGPKPEPGVFSFNAKETVVAIDKSTKSFRLEGRYLAMSAFLSNRMNRRPFTANIFVTMKRRGSVKARTATFISMSHFYPKTLRKRYESFTLFRSIRIISTVRKRGRTASGKRLSYYAPQQPNDRKYAPTISSVICDRLVSLFL